MALHKRDIPVTDAGVQEALAQIGYKTPEGAQLQTLMEFTGSDLSNTTMDAIFGMLDETSATMLFLGVLSRTSGFDFLDPENPPTIEVSIRGTRLIIGAVPGDRDHDGEPF